MPINSMFSQSPAIKPRMVVMVYLSLAGLKLQDEDAAERFKAWYFYVRFLLFFMTMFMMAGGGQSELAEPRFTSWFDECNYGFL